MKIYSNPNLILNKTHANKPKKDNVITDSTMGEDHPIVWTNCVGKGKAFYSAMGHKGKYFLEPLHMDLIKSGIIWASDKSTKCN